MHSDGLPEKKTIRSPKLVPNKYKKLAKKSRNTKHKIARNREMERQTDRQTCSHETAQAANRFFT